MSRIQQAIARLNSISQQGTGGTPRLGGRELLKQQVREQLTKRLDLNRLRGATTENLRRDIRRAIEHLCDSVNPMLARPERENLVDELFDEMVGYGPLEPLLRDLNVREILIVEWQTLLARRSGGVLERIPTTFRSDEHWREILDRICVQLTGQALKDAGMSVDCVLPGGERFTAVIPPLDLGLSPMGTIQRRESRVGMVPGAARPGTETRSLRPSQQGTVMVPRPSLPQRIQQRLAVLLQENQITNLNALSEDELREVVAHATAQVLEMDGMALGEQEQTQLVQTVMAGLPRK